MNVCPSQEVHMVVQNYQADFTAGNSAKFLRMPEFVTRIIKAQQKTWAIDTLPRRAMLSIWVR